MVAVKNAPIGSLSFSAEEGKMIAVAGGSQFGRAERWRWKGESNLLE